MNRKQERKLQFNLWRYLGRAGDTGGEALSSAETSFGAVFRAVAAAGLGPGEREKRQCVGNAYIIQKFPVGSLCGGKREVK